MKTLQITRFAPLDYSTNEALNTLSTNLSFSGNDVKKIMLTSCRNQEGKSFLSMNLMRTLATMGKRVILVDADLRRSALVSQYGIKTPEKIMGLTHYLAGMCSLDDIVYETNIPDAYLILAGHVVANSLSLLNAPRLTKMLNLLVKTFDIVLVDSPPVGLIIDAAQIAKSCDGVLFVVSENAISRNELAAATKQISQTGCPILGAVLNKVTFDTHSAKKYYHRTYYTHYNNEYYKVQKKKRRPSSKDAQASDEGES